GFFSLRNFEEMRKESISVTHTLEVINELNLLNDSISRIESSGRGYVISGAEELKTELTVQRTQAEISLRKLRALTADNPPQLARLDKIEPLLLHRSEKALELTTLRDSAELRTDAKAAALVDEGQ